MCGPLFLTIAGIGLLSVGTCLGFLTAALFATGAEPAQLVKGRWLDTRRHRLIGLAGRRKESLYTLGSCLREGKDPSGPVADAAHALHRLADRFPALLLRNRPDKYRGDVAGRAVRAAYRTLLCDSTHVLSGSGSAALFEP